MDKPVIIGNATLYFGDCREIMPTITGGVVVTDPPFNIGYHYDNYNDKMDIDDYQEMLRVACRLPSVVVHYPEDLCALSWTLEEIPKKIVAWVYPSNTAKQWRGIAWFGAKPDFTKEGQDYKNPTDKRIAKRIADGKRARLYDWWEINQVKNVSKDKSAHPCQMPIEVMRRIIGITESELVIDPFMGSGTTGIACAMMNRKFIGIESDKKYFDIACERITKANGFN